MHCYQNGNGRGDQGRLHAGSGQREGNPQRRGEGISDQRLERKVFISSEFKLLKPVPPPRSCLRANLINAAAGAAVIDLRRGPPTLYM